MRIHLIRVKINVCKHFIYIYANRNIIFKLFYLFYLKFNYKIVCLIVCDFKRSDSLVQILFREKYITFEMFINKFVAESSTDSIFTMYCINREAIDCT